MSCFFVAGLRVRLPPPPPPPQKKKKKRRPVAAGCHNIPAAALVLLEPTLPLLNFVVWAVACMATFVANVGRMLCQTVAFSAQ